MKLQEIKNNIKTNWIPISFNIQFNQDTKKYEKFPVAKWKDINSENYEKFLDPKKNIGILTGHKSGIIIIDIDFDGVPFWNKMIEENDIPNTVCVLTPTKGYHYYFKYNSKYKDLLKTSTKSFIYDGNIVDIDIRNDGGCVVIPPSKQGKTPYKWINGPENEISELPEWILKYVRKKKDLKDGYLKNFNMTNTDMDNYIYQEDYGHSKLLIDHFKHSIITINKEGLGYVYDYDKALWIERESDYIRTLLSDVLYDFVSQEIDAVNKLEDKLSRESKLRELTKINKNIRRNSHLKNVFELVNPKLRDTNFPAKLNNIPYLIPVKNNLVVDLKNGTLRRRTKEDYFSFECPVNLLSFDDPLINAEKFFKEIMNNDDESKKYLQMVLGYMLTGETNERALFILWGKGANGKSTLFDLLQKILCNFHIQASKDVFIKRDRNRAGASPHLVSLMGARLAVFSETDKQEKLDESSIKQLTGNDLINCRQLYCKEIQFKPVCKLVMLTNNKPVFNSDDQAMIDRLRFIPFLARFTNKPKEGEFKKDESFIKSLMSDHLDEIFTWLVIGAKSWYENNKILSDPPIQIKGETDNYLNELDIIQQFIDSCCEVNDKKYEIRSDLYLAFVNWAKDNGKYLSKLEFFKRLEAREFEFKKNRDGITVVKGLILNSC